MKNIGASPNVHVMPCEVRRMDNFVEDNNIDRLDFVKCDVEGAELLVLKGGLETITTHKPIIFLEMLRKWAAKFSYHPNDIITIMNDIGYSCYVSEGVRLIPFGLVDEDTVFTNYFFVHNDRLDVIR